MMIRLVVPLMAALLTLNVNAQKTKTVSKSKNAKEKTQKAKHDDHSIETIEIKEDEVKDTAFNSSAFAQSLIAPRIEKTYDTTSVPDDAFTAAILKLLQEADVINVALKTAKLQLEKSRAANAGNTDVVEMLNHFDKEFDKQYVKDYYTRLFVRLYRRYYTQQEVEELLVFYRTPLGKKVNATLPMITTDAVTDAEKFGTYVGQKIVQDKYSNK